MKALAWVYMAAAYVFVFLPVAVLVAFSFQDGRLPVPPFQGFSLMPPGIIMASSGKPAG